MKPSMAVLALCLVLTIPGAADEPKVVEATFQTSGNCEQCKARIEEALKIKEVKYAKWDKKKKLVTVALLSPSISLDSLQHRVAAVGHDTGKFRAPDEVYNALPPCCLYRGPGQLTP